MQSIAPKLLANDTFPHLAKFASFLGATWQRLGVLDRCAPLPVWFFIQRPWSFSFPARPVAELQLDVHLGRDRHQARRRHHGRHCQGQSNAFLFDPSSCRGFESRRTTHTHRPLNWVTLIWVPHFYKRSKFSFNLIMCFLSLFRPMQLSQKHYFHLKFNRDSPPWGTWSRTLTIYFEARNERRRKKSSTRKDSNPRRFCSRGARSTAVLQPLPIQVFVPLGFINWWFKFATPQKVLSDWLPSSTNEFRNF